ncbi:hypothetical protein ACI797_27020 [Geodermatophilus sp. SYSU D00691]
MTTPTPGSDPNYPQGGAPQGQPGWGAPQQGGYQPAPNYAGGPAGYGAPAGARPSQVTTAAVLGFVIAALALIGALGFFALSTLLGIFALFGILYLGLAALNIVGGVQAIQGKGSTLLKIGGLVTAGLALLGLILALTQGTFDFWSVLLIAAGVAIFFLLNQPASQQFFASRGGR